MVKNKSRKTKLIWVNRANFKTTQDTTERIKTLFIPGRTPTGKSYRKLKMGFNLSKKIKIKKKCSEWNWIILSSTELSVIGGVQAEAAKPRAGILTLGRK